MWKINLCIDIIPCNLVAVFGMSDTNQKGYWVAVVRMTAPNQNRYLVTDVEMSAPDQNEYLVAVVGYKSKWIFDGCCC